MLNCCHINQNDLNSEAQHFSYERDNGPKGGLGDMSWPCSHCTVALWMRGTLPLPKLWGIWLLDHMGSVHCQLSGPKILRTTQTVPEGHPWGESPPEGSLLHHPSPPKAAQEAGAYLLCLGVGVVEDHRRIALPPQVTEDTVVLHLSWEGCLQLVLPFPETEGLKPVG